MVRTGNAGARERKAATQASRAAQATSQAQTDAQNSIHVPTSLASGSVAYLKEKEKKIRAELIAKQQAIENAARGDYATANNATRLITVGQAHERIRSNGKRKGHVLHDLSNRIQRMMSNLDIQHDEDKDLYLGHPLRHWAVAAAGGFALWYLWK